MENLIKLTPELLIDARCQLLGTIDPFNDSYSIRYIWENGEMARAYMKRADICNVDPRLVEVFDALLAGNKKIDGALVTYTASVLWVDANENHVLDPELAQPGSDRMHNWRLNKLIDIERFLTLGDHVNVRVDIYREDRTASGVCYASAAMQTALVRSFDWLNAHFRGGSELLAFGESVGMSRAEIISSIQEQYRPRLAESVVNPALPLDLNPS